jgi:Na+/H+ antiporter NhaA
MNIHTSNLQTKPWNKSPYVGWSIASLVATSLAVPLVWLILPILVFPPIGVLLAIVAFSRTPSQPLTLSIALKVIAVLLMAYAVGIFLFLWNFIGTGYRA